MQDEVAQAIADDLMKTKFNVLITAFQEHCAATVPLYQLSLPDLVSLSTHVTWYPFEYDAPCLPILIQGKIDLAKALKQDPHIKLREIFIQLLRNYETANVQVFPTPGTKGCLWAALHTVLEVELPKNFLVLDENNQPVHDGDLDLMLIKSATSISALMRCMTDGNAIVKQFA